MKHVLELYNEIKPEKILSFCYEFVCANNVTLMQNFVSKIDITYTKSEIYFLAYRLDDW
eukprot:UN26911